MATSLSSLPANISENKRSLLSNLINELTTIPGMQAIVLGGSYASGRETASSDIDLGLYYREASPFSLTAIKKIAEEISHNSMPTVTGFYDWGPWVNGGAWIETREGKVDFLYRNLDQVEKTIEEALQGIVRSDYYQQPTHGFHSVIYLAETEICIPLFDPRFIIAALKVRIIQYPQPLKRTIVQNSLWGSEFALLHARHYSASGDIYNTTGCISRISAHLTQALFALNERYFLGDKRVMEIMAGFPVLPTGYIEQLNALIACPGQTTPELQQSVGWMEKLWDQIVTLAGELYHASFRLPSQHQKD